MSVACLCWWWCWCWWWLILMMMILLKVILMVRETWAKCWQNALSVHPLLCSCFPRSSHVRSNGMISIIVGYNMGIIFTNGEMHIPNLNIIPPRQIISNDRKCKEEEKSWRQANVEPIKKDGVIVEVVVDHLCRDRLGRRRQGPHLTFGKYCGPVGYLQIIWPVCVWCALVNWELQGFRGRRLFWLFALFSWR